MSSLTSLPCRHRIVASNFEDHVGKTKDVLLQVTKGDYWVDEVGRIGKAFRDGEPPICSHV